MTLNILDLPSEILCMIFSWVPSRDLLSKLPRVCRQLRDILHTEWYWKTHYVRLSRCQPCIEQDGLRRWQKGCLQSEFAQASDGYGLLDVNTLTGAVGGLDCVHIMHPALHGANAVIVAGSRDSSLYVWRRRGSNDERGVVNGRSMRAFTSSTLTGHKGWVWSLTSDRDHRPQLLCSGAWDHTVRLWDVSVGKSVDTIKNLHKAAVLSLAIPQRDVLVSASYDKMVRELDMRTPVSINSFHSQHTRPVLSIASTERYTYSASEDKTVCVWDRRAQQEIERVMFERLVPSIHLECGMLSVASGKNVHLFDVSQGTLSNIDSFPTDHSLNLTSVLHNMGMIVTAAKDNTVCVYNGGMDHRHIATLENHSSAVTALDFSKNTLATASGDRNVLLWTQK